MELRNSNGITLWVPNEAFEFIQKIWKPEYQWSPVPVDKSLARAPEQMAFIQTRPPAPEPETPTSQAPPSQKPNTPGNEPKTSAKPSVLQALRALAGRRRASTAPPVTEEQEPDVATEAASAKPPVAREPKESAVDSKPSAAVHVQQTGRAPAAGPTTLAAPPLPQTPRVVPGTPKTPRTPLPPLETSLLRQRPETFRDGPASAELETAITAISSPGDTEPLQTPSTATELESPWTPRESLKPSNAYVALPLPAAGQASGLRKPTPQAPGLDPVGDEAYQPPRGPWPTVGEWRSYLQENQWAGHQQFQGLRPGGWDTVENTRALPMPGDLPPPPGLWKLEDGRGNYQRKAGTRAAAWKTLDGSRRNLDTSDSFVSRRRNETAWHGSEKGFAMRTDVLLNVEVQMTGSVSGDITLSSEALFAI